MDDHTDESLRAHRAFILERQRAANQAVLAALDGLLELLREDVTGIVGKVQIVSLERSDTNRKLIDNLSTSFNALENKVTLLTSQVRRLTEVTEKLLEEREGGS